MKEKESADETWHNKTEADVFINRVEPSFGRCLGTKTGKLRSATDSVMFISNQSQQLCKTVCYLFAMPDTFHPSSIIVNL